MKTYSKERAGKMDNERLRYELKNFNFKTINFAGEEEAILMFQQIGKAFGRKMIFTFGAQMKDVSINTAFKMSLRTGNFVQFKMLKRTSRYDNSSLSYNKEEGKFKLTLKILSEKGNHKKAFNNVVYFRLMENPIKLEQAIGQFNQFSILDNALDESNRVLPSVDVVEVKSNILTKEEAIALEDTKNIFENNYKKPVIESPIDPIVDPIIAKEEEETETFEETLGRLKAGIDMDFPLCDLTDELITALTEAEREVIFSRRFAQGDWHIDKTRDFFDEERAKLLLSPLPPKVEGEEGMVTIINEDDEEVEDEEEDEEDDL